MPLPDLIGCVDAQPFPTGGSSVLGIPSMSWWSEATHGAASRASYNATMFPMPSLTGCAWNMSLVAEIARATGREGRALGNLGGNSGLDYWAPNVNAVRQPLWGRAQEVMSEDPVFNAAWAIAYVGGLQEGDGTDPRYLQVAATMKHYTGYDYDGGPRTPVKRNSFDAAITPQDLVDTYNVPFAAAVQTGRVAGVMASYNAVNGVPAAANGFLLTDVLDGWGFDGYKTGDCGAVEQVGGCDSSNGCHNYTTTNSSTVSVTLRAGLTMDCGNGYKNWMAQAIEDGSVSLAQLQAAAAAQIRVRMRLGEFDDPASQPMAQWGAEQLCSAGAIELSQRAAEESMVLLKNAPSPLGLPLSPAAVSTVAVVGGNANDTMMQLCSYYATPCGGFGGMTSLVAALPGLVKSVNYQLGCDAGCGSTDGFAAAVAAAASAEATIIAAGLNCKLAGEGNDRADVSLPGHQPELIAQVCAAAAGAPGGPRPCILVVHSGSSLDISGALADPNVTAVLFAGYGGPWAGSALARVLFGLAAPPAGRLTQTWYTAAWVGEASPLETHMRPGPSAFPPGTSPGFTHRFYTGRATLLPFGFGLSYTNWSYAPVDATDAGAAWEQEQPATVALSVVRGYVRPVAEALLAGGTEAALRASLALSAADGPVAATYAVNVTNTGRVDSDEVVMGFLVPPGAGTDGNPLQELFSWARVHVPAGQTVTVWLPVQARSFTQVDADGFRQAAAGTYTVQFGARGPRSGVTSSNHAGFAERKIIMA